MRDEIQLDQLRIASPCDADWEAMAVRDGGGNVRHCGSCDRNVYNISGMTSAEARGLIAASEGRLCVRLYRRVDGTVLTADCPIGRRAARWAAAKVAAWALLITGTITGAAAAMRSGDTNTAGRGADWLYRTQVYQTIERWANPAPPPPLPLPMLGTPMLMGEMAPAPGPRAVMDDVAGPLLGRLAGPMAVEPAEPVAGDVPDADSGGDFEGGGGGGGEGAGQGAVEAK